LLSIYTKRVSDGVQRSNHLLDVVYDQAIGESLLQEAGQA
jgi:hypothetical protein